MELKQSETEQTLQLINEGMSRAAAALAKLLDREVLITELKVQQGTARETIKKLHHKDQLIILQTEVIGDLRGQSFLLLTEPEAIAILEMTLNNHTFEHMGMEYLKEIDNILSAAVVAAMADLLELTIYGDVPHFYKMEGQELTSWIEEQKLSQQFNGTEPEGINFGALLQIRAPQPINLNFIWYLNKNILYHIRKLVNSKSIEGLR